jgi:large subunit ribosomal protein L35
MQNTDKQAGDMSKPIYRHLADKKWRSYERKVVVQRMEQMAIVPDILADIDPVVSTKLAFRWPSNLPGGNSRKERVIPHGDFVESRLSEYAPKLHIQPYTQGEQLVTIALINPDVPDVAKDGYNYRCHYLACNVTISPTRTSIPLGQLLPDSQVLHDWLPAYAQKGAPYQRMAIIVLAQPPVQSPPAGSNQAPESKTIDIAQLKEAKGKFARREGFTLRGFVDRFQLKPIGVHLFRTQWDDGTAGVMQRAGIPGWDVEFKRKRIDPLPYKRLKEERYR